MHAERIEGNAKSCVRGGRGWNVHLMYCSRFIYNMIDIHICTHTHMKIMCVCTLGASTFVTWVEALHVIFQQMLPSAQMRMEKKQNKYHMAWSKDISTHYIFHLEQFSSLLYRAEKNGGRFRLLNDFSILFIFLYLKKQTNK